MKSRRKNKQRSKSKRKKSKLRKLRNKLDGADPIAESIFVPNFGLFKSTIDEYDKKGEKNLIEYILKIDPKETISPLEYLLNNIEKEEIQRILSFIIFDKRILDSYLIKYLSDETITKFITSGKNIKRFIFSKHKDTIKAIYNLYKKASIDTSCFRYLKDEEYQSVTEDMLDVFSLNNEDEREQIFDQIIDIIMDNGNIDDYVNSDCNLHKELKNRAKTILNKQRKLAKKRKHDETPFIIHKKV